jgi:hypothetical protein
VSGPDRNKSERLSIENASERLIFSGDKYHRSNRGVNEPSSRLPSDNPIEQNNQMKIM